MNAPTRWASLLAAATLVTICGCKTCPQTWYPGNAAGDICRATRVPHQTPDPQSHPLAHNYQRRNNLREGAGNPLLVFGRSGAPLLAPLETGEIYGRQQWPTSPHATTYVRSGEIVTFREYRYDDQYIAGDNEARVHFHDRYRSYRSGLLFR